MNPRKIDVALAVIVLVYSASATAQLPFYDTTTNQGVLDQVVSAFSTRAAAWQTVVMASASWLFWTLGTISLAWTMGMLALKKADLGDFFAEFVRFTLFFGFFFWLLQNGPRFADSIIRSLRQIGDGAAGTTGLSPSGVVDVGFMIWNQAIRNLSAWSPIDSFIGMLLSAGILCLLAVVALNMLVLLVSGWILMYAGIFFLGFGGSRWTSEMAINYFKTVLAVAVQLFAMILLVGIGQDMLSTFYEKMSKGVLNFEELGVMLVFCISLLFLVGRVPAMMASVITGGGGASHLGSVGAGAMVGAAAMAAAAVSTAGTALAAGATGMAGGTQAIMAAFSKASAANSTASEGAESLSAAVEGGSNTGTGHGSGGGSGLAAAMGGGTDSSTVDTAFARSGAGARTTSDTNGSDDAVVTDDKDFDRAGTSIAEIAADDSGNSIVADEASPRQENGDRGDSSLDESAAGSATPERSRKSRALAAAGRAGKVAAQTAANLSRGSWDIARGKVSDMSAAFNGRVSETTGGRIATAINERHAGAGPTGNGDTIFGEDSLGKAEPVESEQEIAAFRDRGTAST
jgi:type IV secretion system protein TrbL